MMVLFWPKSEDSCGRFVQMQSECDFLNSDEKKADE